MPNRNALDIFNILNGKKPDSKQSKHNDVHTKKEMSMRESTYLYMHIIYLCAGNRDDRIMNIKLLLKSYIQIELQFQSDRSCVHFLLLSATLSLSPALCQNSLERVPSVQTNLYECYLSHPWQ